MNVDDSQRRGVLEYGAVHDQLAGGKHHTAVVLLQAGLDQVLLGKGVEHGSGAGDEAAIAHAHAHFAAVGGGHPAAEQVMSEFLKLLKHGSSPSPGAGPGLP